jgi:feruloyl esterase
VGELRGLGLSIALVAAVFAGCGSDSSNGDAPPQRVVTSTATAINTAAPTSTLQPATATVPPTPVPTLTASVSPRSTGTAPPSPTPTSARTPVACSDLAGAEIAGARVTATEMVDATDAATAYCKLSAIIDPSLRFELRLPPSWNRKVLFLGGSGYDGVIPAPDVLRPGPGVVTLGYATIGTDSGHMGGPFDGAFALDRDALDDFAYLARHRVLEAAREIIATHYATSIRRAYFEGGSSGGREALIEAQRWPDSFDGVIARAPALDFTAVMLNANRIVQRAYGSADAWLPMAAVQTLSGAVLAACDQLDGLADAIVGNVAACHFDPAALRCADGNTGADCLSDAQIETANTIFSALQLDLPLANGRSGYPAYPLSGAEDGGGGWPLWMTGFAFDAPNSLLFLLQDQYFKYFVTRDAQFDSLQLAPTAYASEIGALSTLLDATDPDLSAFTAHGGKVILWHGLADYAISAYGTLRYYESVVAAAGGQEQADAFIRFYASPAVDHTGSGNGAPLFDLLGALDAWVEDGTAPGDLVAYRLDDGVEIPFRPLCRYPTYPRYDGVGDPHSAASFACVAP